MPDSSPHNSPSRYYPPEPGTIPCAEHGDNPEMWVCGMCLDRLLEQLQAERGVNERMAADYHDIEQEADAARHERDELQEQFEARETLLRDCLDYIEHMEKHWGGGIAGSVGLKRRIRDSFPAKSPRA